ncbi:LysR family transcriptional regulator [Paenibacillus shenyangensis]|uniref:LysR family transcriptional regulator n=1 Tax=Paenibacillus sp. A9 TaxID=1284352 RepID=UPI00037DB485|nr:LysR family transcriptional regulator [Paenibacillus sp. A9]
MMDIRQLHYYCTIIEEGQITRAARTLHMAQPPLSQQLRLMEEELGVVLIHREGKRWEVTQAGQRLYERARHLLREMENIQQEISDVDQGLTGSITIGTSSICISRVSRHISEFHRDYPEVYHKILYGDTSHLEELLHQHKIDFALLLLPVEDERDYEIMPLSDDPFVAVVPREWTELCQTESLTLEQIAEYPLLLARRMSGEGAYENIIGEFEQRQLQPRVVLDCPDISALFSFAAAGMGLTLIPESEIQQVYADRLCVIPLQQAIIRTRPALVWLKSRYMSKAARQLIQRIITS